MSMNQFDLQAKKDQDTRYMTKRFESLLKTVAENDKVLLRITGQGASTDGKVVQMAHPDVFYKMGFTPDEAVDTAIYCIVHEAAHIMYSGIPKDTLEPAHQKYTVVLGYEWQKLFLLIDMLEDYRVNTLNERVRPGTQDYRLRSSRRLTREIKGGNPVEIALMTEYFAEIPHKKLPKNLVQIHKQARALFSDFAGLPASTIQTAVEYAVKMYDVIYGKPNPQKQNQQQQNQQKQNQQKQQQQEGGDEQEYEYEYDEQEGDNDTQEVEDEATSQDAPDGDDENEEDENDDDGDGDGENEEGQDGEEEEEEGEPDGDPDDGGEQSTEETEPTLDFDNKPSIMLQTQLTSKMEEPQEEQPESGYPQSIPCRNYGGTVYQYEYAPVQNARIIDDMIRKNSPLHADERIAYVKLPKDKLDFDGVQHSNDMVRALERLTNPTNEQKIRTFIAKAANYLKMDNDEEVTHRRSGRVDVARMWRAGCEIHDPAVFAKKLEESKGDTALYILADNSGSMSGMLAATQQALYMLSKLAVDYEIPCKVVCFDRGYISSYGRNVVHVELKDWDEKDCRGIARYGDGCANRDGLDIQIASLELAQRPETNKILFILSDGLPSDYGDDKEAIDDVAQEVRKARGRGQNVLGVYMLDPRMTEPRNKVCLEQNVTNYKYMYGQELYTITDIPQIPTLLLRALARFTK